MLKCTNQTVNIQLTKAWLELNIVCRSFNIIMKAKLVKWGVKVWVCADGVTGYVCTFSIYAGKDPAKPPNPKGLAYEVVTSLTKNYHNQVYILYTNNFYTSPELSRDLLDLGTYSSGTVRINRKHFPAVLLNACALPERGSCVLLLWWHSSCEVAW